MADEFKVLLAVDSSEHADHAFNYYLKHIHKPKHTILLMHVAEMPCSSTMSSGAAWEETIERERQRTKSLEEAYVQKLAEHGLTARVITSLGHKPGENIVQTANEEKVQMIVLGTRGLGMVRRTILGSVSDYVVHHAHCAIVVTRQ